MTMGQFVAECIVMGQELIDQERVELDTLKQLAIVDAAHAIAPRCLHIGASIDM